MRRRRIPQITDEALICFVKWARLNDHEIVTDPITARRVLEAYAGMRPTIDPGIARAERLAIQEEAMRGE